MKYLVLMILLIACTSKEDLKRGHAGASAGQTSAQEGIDGLSSPQMPATQLPPPGTVQPIPVVTP